MGKRKPQKCKCRTRKFVKIRVLQWRPATDSQPASVNANLQPPFTVNTGTPLAFYRITMYNLLLCNSAAKSFNVVAARVWKLFIGVNRELNSGHISLPWSAMFPRLTCRQELTLLTIKAHPQCQSRECRIKLFRFTVHSHDFTYTGIFEIKLLYRYS